MPTQSRTRAYQAERKALAERRYDAIPANAGVVSMLNSLACSVADLRLTTHLVHVSLQGNAFYANHLLAERVYGGLDDEIDTVLEHLRTMNQPVPTSGRALVDGSMLPALTNPGDPVQAIGYLADASAQLRDLCNQLAIAADAAGDQLTVDLAGGLGREHASHYYLLSSVLQRLQG